MTVAELWMTQVRWPDFKSGGWGNSLVCYAWVTSAFRQLKSGHDGCRSCGMTQLKHLHRQVNKQPKIWFSCSYSYAHHTVTGPFACALILLSVYWLVHLLCCISEELQEKLQELIQQLEEIREKRLELESQMAEAEDDLMRVSLCVCVCVCLFVCWFDLLCTVYCECMK